MNAIITHRNVTEQQINSLGPILREAARYCVENGLWTLVTEEVSNDS